MITGRIATEWSTNAATLIRVGPTDVYGCLLETDGTANATLALYDSSAASTSSKLMRQFTVPGYSYYGGFELINPILAHNGLYIKMTTTGAAGWSATIYYP